MKKECQYCKKEFNGRKEVKCCSCHKTKENKMQYDNTEVSENITRHRRA